MVKGRSMQRIQKIFVTLVLTLMVLGTAATVVYAAPKFNKSSVTLKLKKSVKMKLTKLSKNQKKKQWKFSSSDNSVVTVKKSSKTTCKITAKKKNGYAVVKASQGKTTVYMLVKAGNGGDPTYSSTTKNWAKKGKISLPEAPGEFSVSTTTLNIGSDSVATLYITFEPKGTVSWAADESMIQCEWGDFHNNVCPLTITAFRSGTTTLKITNDVDSRVLKVTINSENVLDFSVSNSEITTNVGEEQVVYVTFGGEEVEWEIEDEDIADCSWGDFSGNVCPLYIEGLASGSTYITITNDNDDRKLYVDVNVN